MNFKKINTSRAGSSARSPALSLFSRVKPPPASGIAGEFIPCAYRLETLTRPEPPEFILLGRLFIILFGGNINVPVGDPHAAVQVNMFPP